MEIGIIGDGRNSKMELRYKIYCLNYITQDIQNIIDSEPLTYEQFCKKYIEEGRQ